MLMTWLQPLLDWLFEGFQRRCDHPSEKVMADIMAGQDPQRAVQWCLRCGAYRHGQVVGPAAMRMGEWQAPRATW